MYIETSSPLNNRLWYVVEDWLNSMLQNTRYTKFKAVGSIRLLGEGPAWQRDVKVLWGSGYFLILWSRKNLVWRCLMKGDLAPEVELLAEVMKEKLWGTVLNSSPQYMKSLNGDNRNGRGNRNVKVQLSVWKASVLQKIFSLLKHGGKNNYHEETHKVFGEMWERTLFFLLVIHLAV